MVGQRDAAVLWCSLVRPLKASPSRRQSDLDPHDVDLHWVEIHGICCCRRAFSVTRPTVVVAARLASHCCIVRIDEQASSALREVYFHKENEVSECLRFGTRICLTPCLSHSLKIQTNKQTNTRAMTQRIGAIFFRELEKVRAG